MKRECSLESRDFYRTMRNVETRIARKWWRERNIATEKQRGEKPMDLRVVDVARERERRVWSGKQFVERSRQQEQQKVRNGSRNGSSWTRGSCLRSPRPCFHPTFPYSPSYFLLGESIVLSLSVFPRLSRFIVGARGKGTRGTSLTGAFADRWQGYGLRHEERRGWSKE